MRLTRGRCVQLEVVADDLSTYLVQSTRGQRIAVSPSNPTSPS